MSEAYDQLAGVYDASFRGSVARAEDLLIREQLALSPGGLRVLDVGCGTGLLLELFPHLAVAGGRYLGIDVSAAMLERARGKFPAATFLQMDVRRMGRPLGGVVEPGSCDVVVALHSLGHVDEPEQALGEIANALAPGGRFFLTFFGRRYPGRRSYIMNRQDVQAHATFNSLSSLTRLLDDAGLGPHYAVSGLNVHADHLGWLPAPAVAAWMRAERRRYPIDSFYHLVVDGRKVA